MKFLYSLLVMVPWPLLALALTYTMLDQPDEASLLVGGITALFILPIYLIAELSEAVFAGIAVAVWGAAWIIPPCLLPEEPSRRAVKRMLVMQGAFSLAQAALGTLMIWGKGA